MRPEPNAISCAVCRDLAPLVEDGVASADSAALVRAHLAACPSCAAEWPALAAETGAPPAAETPLPAGPDDARVLRRLRRRLKNRTALLLAAGVVGGTLLTYSRYSVLVFLFFPLVCGVLCWQRDPAWRVLPPLTLTVSALAAFISSQLEHSYTNLWAAVRGALGWGVFTAALCLVGALAGYWLAYAFKKEEEEK